MMKRSTASNSFKGLFWFLLPFTIWVIALAIALFTIDKASLHLYMNFYHTPFWDVVFKYFTEVGASIPYIIAAGLLLYKYKATLMVLAGQLIPGLFTQICKHIWNEPRPIVYFSEHLPNVVLPQVEGVHLHHYHSFPSGHTTAAFALFTTLCLLTDKKPLHLLYFILAALGGYSRIYLSQHFAIDVWAGSLIGVCGSLLAGYLVNKIQADWDNQSLRTLFRKQTPAKNL